MMLPGLARLWRDAHTLQLGLDPTLAVLLDVADIRSARLLDLLAGDQPERVVLTRARRLGIDPDHARAVLDTLHAAGLVVGAHTLLPPQLPDARRQRLTGEAVALALRAVEAVRSRAGHRPPAQVLRRRAAARVVVTGRGRLAAPLAVALAQSGVGHVHADVSGRVAAAELGGGPLAADDVERPLREAIADAVTRAAPDTRTHPVRRGAAALVVQLAYEQPVALLAAGHRQRRQPHLAVTVREGTAIVGPFVPPTGGPCLNCLDLHRRDRDPAWPRLGAQLNAAVGQPCTAATALAATGYATNEALVHLDGGTPQTVGAAVEIDGAGRIRRRAWPPHPACGCTGRRTDASTGGRVHRRGQ